MQSLLVTCVVGILCLGPRSLNAQVISIFAYQGVLTEAGEPRTGTFEMEFRLFDTPDVGTGTQQGPTISDPAVLASNGVFTVLLDFGITVFDGSPRYLEIAVRSAGSVDPLSVLMPRQAVMPVPYAIHSLSASALNGVPSASLVQVDANGNVGIGTVTPASGVRLDVYGPTRVTAGGSGGYMQIGTPNGETGLGTRGTNRFDLRFNGHTVTLAAGSDAGPPPPQSGITLNTNGNVGIGMSSPLMASEWKLEVNGPLRLNPFGDSGGTVQFSTPNGETGLSILDATRANRADVRFDGQSLKLLAGTGTLPPGDGIFITTASRVGIGTSTPGTKLDVAGDIAGTRLVLRADPVAPMNAAVLCENAGVTNFVPYNTALGRAMNIVVHDAFIRDATVRTLTILGGADLAEPFPMKDEAIEKGSVVVIDEEQPGQLKRSTRAYDPRVAGIISGANGINPGISLRQEGVLEGSENVALTGRVYVRADASNGAIEPGDMLTSSDTPGHAMKVTDHGKAQGAIIGKAMGRLPKGQGMVLVLVTLQ